MNEKIVTILDRELLLDTKNNELCGFGDVADQLLTLICEEIEKSLLTDEEIRFLRDAANIQENKLLLGDTTILCERAIAQAQLQKILSLLRSIENPVGSVDL